MNRKYNPYVSLVALLLLALILALTCTGCTSRAEAAETERPTRFAVEHVPYSWETDLDALYIITDTETGAQYLFADGYNCGGLCKLEG